MRGQCCLRALAENVTEVDVVVRQCDRNPLVALGDETLDRSTSDGFEVDIQPRLTDVGQTATERDEGEAPICQELYPRIDAAGVGKDDPVDEAARHHATQVLIGVF